MGLTQDFGELADLTAKSKEIKDIIFKFKNEPIKLGEISENRSNQKLLREVTKIRTILIQVRRGKEKQLYINH